MDISKIEKHVKSKLENYPKRLIHTFGVCEMAVKLAEKFNIDTEKAYVAALLHDVCKYDDLEVMKELINDNQIIEEYKNVTEAYHAFAAANYAKNILNIEDEDIINAIRYHVMGRIGMSKLEEIIYISDYTEKNRNIESCIICRNELENNYNKAIYLSYDFVIKYLEKNNMTVFDCQYKLREFYKGKEE